MKAQKIAWLCGTLWCLGGSAWAQPPIDEAPLTPNPPNWERRQRGRQRGGQIAIDNETRRTLMVRNLLTRAGFADEAIQNAVTEHMTARATARAKVEEAGRKLMQVFNQQRRNNGQILTDAQLDTLLADYRGALEADHAAREEAEKALDQKIQYSKNARLEIALVVVGAIGDEQPLAGAALGRGMLMFGLPEMPALGRGNARRRGNWGDGRAFEPWGGAIGPDINAFDVVPKREAQIMPALHAEN
jgi:hypothetical protein